MIVYRFRADLYICGTTKKQSPTLPAGKHRESEATKGNLKISTLRNNFNRGIWQGAIGRGNTLDLDIRICKCCYPVEVVVNGKSVTFLTLAGNEITNCLYCAEDFKRMYLNKELENAKELNHMPNIFRLLNKDQKHRVDNELAKAIGDVVRDRYKEYFVNDNDGSC